MSTKEHSSQLPAEYSDIAPYNESQFHEKLAGLTKEPGFEHAVRFVMPEVDYPAFCEELKKVNSQKEFQIKIMGDFLTRLEKMTTSGVTSSGLENVEKDKSYTYISNHRDIVLDASFLNLVMLRNGYPVTQVAIGNNLLIMPWITDLVKINRSFIVKRDVKRLEALNAARQLSGYIHWTVDMQKESVWIAQREGRAKDSNDRTQESLVKMLSFAGEGDPKENLQEINIVPVSISYEFDPNDYLKVREFLLKKRDPEFKKTQHDDLFSMETGMLGFKGRVHFAIGKCITPELGNSECEDRNSAAKETCRLIDNQIHSGYYLYPINYIAYDRLNATDRYADHYTADDIAKTDEYIRRQIEKVDVENITTEEQTFMKEMMLTMYANPVKNKFAEKA